MEICSTGKTNRLARLPTRKKRQRVTHNPEMPRVAAMRRNRLREVSLFLHPPCHSRGIWHYMRDCNSPTDEEKKAPLKQLADDRAKTGPAKSKRSQTTMQQQKTEYSLKSKTTGRLNRKVKIDMSNPSFTVTAKDGKEELTEATNRYRHQNLQRNVSLTA